MSTEGKLPPRAFVPQKQVHVGQKRYNIHVSAAKRQTKDNSLLTVIVLLPGGIWAGLELEGLVVKVLKKEKSCFRREATCNKEGKG